MKKISDTSLLAHWASFDSRLALGQVGHLGKGPRMVLPSHPTLGHLASAAHLRQDAWEAARAAWLDRVERGLSAVPARDRERIAAGARAIGIEVFDVADAATMRAYRDIDLDDDEDDEAGQ